jgi:hypothetical protein
MKALSSPARKVKKYLTIMARIQFLNVTCPLKYHIAFYKRRPWPLSTMQKQCVFMQRIQLLDSGSRIKSGTTFEVPPISSSLQGRRPDGSPQKIPKSVNVNDCVWAPDFFRAWARARHSRIAKCAPFSISYFIYLLLIH